MLQRAQGIPARAICADTFTNKADEEMRERIALLLGDKKQASELTIGTFHALGLQILRSERKALGYPRGFAIYDQSDQMGALREAMRHIHDGDRRYDVKAIQARISNAKSAFIAPEEFKGNPADDYDVMTVNATECSGRCASQSSSVATRCGCARLRARNPAPCWGMGSWSVDW